VVWCHISTLIRFISRGAIDPLVCNCLSAKYQSTENYIMAMNVFMGKEVTGKVRCIQNNNLTGKIV
jgi:hypothetical protein